MRCVCYICGTQYRIKPPIDNDQVSHGLCEECFPVEIKRLKKELAAMKKKTEYEVLPLAK